jgi:multidrug efflux system membrane fusion protein
MGRIEIEMVKFSFPAIAVSFILSAFLAGCSDGVSGQSSKKVSGGPPSVPVTVGTVEQKSMPVELRAIGNVQPYSTVSVKALVAGELIGVHFREGQDVKQGDLLFTIDSRPFEAQLKQAEANLARDRIQLENARKEVQRLETLYKEGFASQQQYDQVHTNAAALEAVVQADEAVVVNTRLQLEYSSIRSPIEGRTGNLMVHEGNLVKANENPPLVTINQIRPIYVSFSVPEQNLSEIKKYMGSGKLKVEAISPKSEGRPLVGELTFVDNTIDPGTGTILLKATFPNRDGTLWPGQFVNVTLFLTTQANAVVVPSQAIQTGQKGSYLFVVKPDLTVETRPVTVDRITDNQAVITEGVKPGETVVTDGQLRLSPGAKVQVKDGAPADTLERTAH